MNRKTLVSALKSNTKMEPAIYAKISKCSSMLRTKNVLLEKPLLSMAAELTNGVNSNLVSNGKTLITKTVMLIFVSKDREMEKEKEQ